MASETVICRRCGAGNPAGDQFCGTCGAFLEWEGEAGAAENLAPAENRAPPETPTPVAAPPATVAPPVALPPGSVTCSKCGTANPPGRTFCQKCGSKLGPSAASPIVAAASAGAAGAAPARSAPQPASSGGLPGWLPIVAVVGLLVGAGVVVYTLLLRPTPSSSLASAAPSATFTPTLPPSAGPASSGGSGGSSGAPESVQLTTTGATASSVAGDKKEFSADKAIDGRLDTCWQEGAADELGQWIEVTLAASRLDYVVIYSGYQLSHDAYLAFRRPKDVIVSVNGGPKVAFTLADSEQPQRLDIDDVAGATTVRLEIITSYDPQKTAYAGSPFDDLAISEIRVFGGAGG